MSTCELQRVHFVTMRSGSLGCGCTTAYVIRSFVLRKCENFNRMEIFLEYTTCLQGIQYRTTLTGMQNTSCEFICRRDLIFSKLCSYLAQVVFCNKSTYIFTFSLGVSKRLLLNIKICHVLADVLHQFQVQNQNIFLKSRQSVTGEIYFKMC